MIICLFIDSFCYYLSISTLYPIFRSNVLQFILDIFVLGYFCAIHVSIYIYIY